MGEVYLAQQLSLDRPVALKVLRPDLLANATHQARFEKEALSAAKLNDPNIVHIYQLGSFDEVKYIAMEYVAGTNLRDYLAKRGIPALPLALSIMRQAGQAVKAAGEVGLVHRDIKPENLLITRKGQVKIADFGLSRAQTPENVNLTQPGVALGTPMYMSPEQVQGKAVDHRSDLYALGVTFYHMLAGEPPFHAETGLALAMKHVHEAAVDLAVHRPDLPPELCRLVMKLMAKDPAARYPSAGEMLRDLAGIKEALNATVGSSALAATEPMTSTGVAAIPAGTRTASRTTEEVPTSTSFLSGRLLVPLVLCGLAAGSLFGYLGRAEDLLRADSAQAEGPPGLWIAPWAAVPEKHSPEEQYRYAQLDAPEAEREAAWLAVPGRFPRSHEWSSKAYVQLVRTLFRHRDTERLDGLGAELARSTNSHDRKLSHVALAAAAALRDESEELVEQLNELDIAKLDPPLAEIALEATLRAQGRGAGSASFEEKLRRQRNALLNALQIQLLPPKMIGLG
jgi:serine/threonine-protein kinase